mgnify:CR=1 FL=1
MEIVGVDISWLGRTGQLLAEDLFKLSERFPARMQATDRLNRHVSLRIDDAVAVGLILIDDLDRQSFPGLQYVLRVARLVVLLGFGRFLRAKQGDQ